MSDESSPNTPQQRIRADGGQPERRDLNDEMQEVSSDYGISAHEDVPEEELFGEGDEPEETDANTSGTNGDQQSIHEERKQMPVMATEDERNQLSALYQSLNSEATLDGRDLEKHRDFFSACIEVILEHEDEVRAKLDLDS